MRRGMPRRFALIAVVSFGLIVGCGGGSESAQPGFETGPCVASHCFEGLVCLSDLCVSLEEPTSSDTGMEGSGPTGASSHGGTSPADEDTGNGSETMGDGDPPPECNIPVPASGQSCESDAACEPGVCFHIPVLGAVCGECTEDADCPCGGCTIPSPISGHERGAVCNTGALGDGCQSSSVCQGSLTCAHVFEIPGIVVLQTCSECDDDSGCSGGQLCSPSIAVWELSGVKQCVAPGSLPLGATCDHLGSGDQACASGRCAVATAGGALDLGVCSECDDDAQCTVWCEEPYVDLDGVVVPGHCL